MTMDIRALLFDTYGTVVDCTQPALPAPTMT